MDRNELKVMALRERVAALTADYEDKVADLRVELTLVSQELEEFKSKEAEAEKDNGDAKASKKKD